MGENRESSEAADKELYEKLKQISSTSRAVHKRIETQIIQLEKEMIKVQHRLEASESKIIEVSRDVQSVKVEMKKMQEILMKINQQGSNVNTKTVTNIVNNNQITVTK